MEKNLSDYLLSLVFVLVSYFNCLAQVDTTFIYNNNTTYGSLDLRIARSASWYYYLQEDQTFSFRESTPGVKTNTFFDMTSWDSSPFEQGHLREKNGTNDSFVMNYRLLKPLNYDASYSPGYPLILIMHGLGESGNCSEHKCHHADGTYSPLTNTPPAPTNENHPLLNNDHHLIMGGRVHLKARNDAGEKLPDDPTLSSRSFPGFVLFPQNLNGWTGRSVEDALRIVRLIAKKYKIDMNRIYIHGLSNGGHGVFEALKRAPWMFAAAATMSAVDDGFINQQKMAPAIAHIPLWVFQGGQDKMPTPLKTENFIKKFRDAGMIVRYTKYPNLGHGTWNTAYGEPDFFSWFLGKSKADLHSFAGATTICGSTGLKLDLPQGYLAYQWELDGQIIEDANTASIEATTAGTYRARFSRIANPSEEDWNQWSQPITLTAGQGIAQPEIKQTGTLLLNDLNDYTNAHLYADGSYDHYYWYRNETLIDFPGDQDDTISHPIITPEMGSGTYTLVVANFDNCSSTPSAAKTIFFNDEAPVNISAPSNFAASVDASQVVLTWTDASDNEEGFEIWRRRKTDATNYTPWEMVVLTSANANSFTDTKSLASSTYEYKIRGVSSSGRSEYTPSASGLVVDTGLDTQAPSAPQNLTATSVGVQKIKLTWSGSTDNIGVKNYYVYYNSDSVATPGADTTFTLSNLELNEEFTFRIKANDISGNLSDPSNEVKGSTHVSGLYYEHSTGVTFGLDSIDWSKPEFTGVVPTFTLEPRTQEDYFNFRFDGFLFIEEEGSYQFRVGSNDGSRLMLDNTILVNNDGVHDFEIVSSEAVSLTAGPHRINVEFFDYNEKDSLLVQYNGPDTGNEWISIPEKALRSSDTLVTAVGPDNGPEDSFLLTIYPNPSTPDNIHLQLKTVSNGPIDITLVNAVGRRIFAREVSRQDIEQGMQLTPEEALAPGIYIITVNQDNSTARQRIVIRN